MADNTKTLPYKYPQPIDKTRPIGAMPKEETTEIKIIDCRAPKDADEVNKLIEEGWEIADITTERILGFTELTIPGKAGYSFNKIQPFDEMITRFVMRKK